MQTPSPGRVPALDARPILRQTIGGFEVASVPLAGAGFAMLDGTTFDLLTAAGLGFTGWHLRETKTGTAWNVCAPSANPARHPVLVVARLIVGASPGQRVRYLNGNRCDLRRFNLRAETRMKPGRLLEPLDETTTAP